MVTLAKGRSAHGRERQINTGEIVKFDKFSDFITSNPPEGLAESADMLLKLLHDDPEVSALFREAMTRKWGERKRKKAEETNNVSLSEKDPVHGNSLSYTLRRLKKERPDLFEKVTSGQMTANQAAIEAGFRKKTISVELTG